MMLGIPPGRFGLGPGLNVFIALLHFGDLIPPVVVTRVIVTTIQSEGGSAKSGNN
jgi:hypothetical protein